MAKFEGSITENMLWNAAEHSSCCIKLQMPKYSFSHSSTQCQVTACVSTSS